MRSPMMALLHEIDRDEPMTLDVWLDLNGVEDELDAELLEVIPAPLRDEYEARLRHNIEMNHRFEHREDAARNEGRRADLNR